jgi:hypothetical protein
VKPLSDIGLPAIVKDPPKEGTLIRAGGVEKPKHRITDRAQKFWDRLIDWYGASKMSDFGDWPGPDLCKLVDAIRSRDDMGALLSNIRSKHPQWPPTFNEIEALVRSLVAPAVDWSKVFAALADHALKTRKLTPRQQMGIPRWTYSPRGVRIPADGDSPEIFIPIEEVTNGQNV